MGGISSAHLRFFFFFFHLLLTLGKKIDNMKPCDIIFPFIPNRWRKLQKIIYVIVLCIVKEACNIILCIRQL